MVSLPARPVQGTELTLTVTYAGRLEPAALNAESIGDRAAGGSAQLGRRSPFDEPEPSYLYSSQTYWYPRPSTSHYATATLRITVPAGLACVASGERDAASPVVVPAGDSMRRPQDVRVPRRSAAPVSGVRREPPCARSGTWRWTSRRAPPMPLDAAERHASISALNMAVEANPGHVRRGRVVAERAIDIARFYQSLLGDSPYPSLTVTLVETRSARRAQPRLLRGALRAAAAGRPFAPRNDPASFEQFPDFVLAHELAHQWWGQAVGWRSYHEQWLSEGFSQYFAALYAERQRGPEGGAVFRGVMRHMRQVGDRRNGRRTDLAGVAPRSPRG